MRNHDHQKGAVAPLIALLLFVIVICVALVVDLGHVHNVKVELQRAVDAAALAGARYLPDEDRVKAVAVATAAANSADQESITITPEDVVLGTWDQENLAAPPDVRFTPTSDEPNAVYVRAIKNVEPFFFLFPDSQTEVVADAIALSRPIYPILPLAMVSCIPTDETATPPGALPNMSLCGVVGLGQNTNYDLAAWTSLTFSPISEQSILDILGTNDDFETFNQIVFGRGLEGAYETGGLENEPPINVTGFNPDDPGCVNDGLTINCGLGEINSKEVAPPDDFNPTGIPDDLPTATNPAGHEYYTGDYTGTADEGFDPLTAYNPLPRWYNIDHPDGVGEDENNDEFGIDDHFIRIMTMDGILLRGRVTGNEETVAEYKARLWDLKTGTMVSPYSASDGTVNRFETLIGGQNVNQAEPDYLAVAKYAGYPLVHVTEGVTTPVLEAFLMRLFDTDDKNDIQNPLPCDDNPPLPGDTNTLSSVRLNVPVIFAGSCEKWKTNPSTKGYYIGMAKLLLTRAMLTNEMFACADPTNPGSCDPPIEDPHLDNLGKFGLDPIVNFNSPSMIEGLFTLPTTDDDTDLGGRVEIFLVE